MQVGGLEGSESNSTMDRKQSGRQSAPPKSGAAESKKEHGNRQFPQHGKRKEGPLSRPRPEGGASNKPAPQKSRTTFDKRPRARGYYNESQKNEVTDNDDLSEYGSAQRPGSKKGYINSLINFSYGEPRSYRNTRGSSNQSWNSRNHWSKGRGFLKYNKEQFLQANCQFVVRGGKDYGVYLAEPDKLVDWELIEQVRIFSPEVPSCPICLYPPTAAKITRCGHIYCWGCMLHYLSLSDKTWRKCPICYESVHSSDLKSVVSMATHSYSVGEQITMRLMKRQRGSLVVMPIGQWSDREGLLFNVNEKHLDISYAKMLECGPDYVQSILDSECTALEVQLADEGSDSLEGSFINAATEQLKERQQELNARKNIGDMMVSLQLESSPGGASVASQADSVTIPIKKLEAKKEDIIVYSDAFMDKALDPSEAGQVEYAEEPLPDSPGPIANEGSDAVTKDDDVVAKEDDRCDSPVMLDCGEATVDAEELELPSESPPVNTRRGRPQAPKDIHYFYQAVGGLHIYMQSLNARCLVHEYGSLANCPETITATIIELESGSMTPDLRGRLRYMNHLPLTCEFKVTELALKHPILSKETIQTFAGELDQRRKRRQRKARDDKRMAKRMQENEDRKLGKYGELNMSLESSTHFPVYSSSINFANEAAVLLATSPGNQSHHSTLSSNSSTPFGSPPSVGLNPDASEFVPGRVKTVASAPELVSMDTNQQSAGSTRSFAQMLKEGKSKPPAWPKPSPESTGVRPTDSDASDSEDRAPVPMYRDSFGDAIEQALQTYQKDKADGESPATDGSVGKKTKKKKQKKLLFTTSMARTK